MSDKKPGATASKNGSVAARLAAFQCLVSRVGFENRFRTPEVEKLIRLWAVDLKLEASRRSLATLKAERSALLAKGGAL